MRQPDPGDALRQRHLSARRPCSRTTTATAGSTRGQPNLGNACNNGMLGVCRTTGTFVCNTANPDGAAVCNAPAGRRLTAETCNGIDDNCNGIVDDGANTGNLAGQEWVAIPRSAVEIMKYEASRPDALIAEPLQTHACSRRVGCRGRTSRTTRPRQACTSIGARLCTEAEWQQMCAPSVTYPVAGRRPRERRTSCSSRPRTRSRTPRSVRPRAWTRSRRSNFNGVTAMQVPDIGFSVTAWRRTRSRSRRASTSGSTLLAATNYRLWLRMRSPGVSAEPVSRDTTAPVAGVLATVERRHAGR